MENGTCKARELDNTMKSPGAKVPLSRTGRGVLLDPDLPSVEEVALLNLANERAIAFDAEGQLSGDLVQGTKNTVNIPARMLHQGFAVTHNHPSGGSFSHDDVHVLAENKVREMRVIGHQSQDRVYLYRLHFLDGATLEQKRKTASRYLELEREIRAQTQTAIEAGRMTGKEVKREFRHLIMSKLKEELLDIVYYARIKLS